jgi:hypothetical protein
LYPPPSRKVELERVLYDAPDNVEVLILLSIVLHQLGGAIAGALAGSPMRRSS